MEKILLLSNSRKLFEITESIKLKYSLIWMKYTEDLEMVSEFPDIIIMHFDEKMMQKKRYSLFIKIKGLFGQFVPILVAIDEGTIQEIFALLQFGAYDYIRDCTNLEVYKRKIEELILWSWYLKKYKKSQG